MLGARILRVRTVTVWATTAPHGGVIIMDEALKAGIAATLCSIALLAVLMVVMRALPVGIG
jgi:hypothetical protein